MVAEAILSRVCNHPKTINRLTLPTVPHKRMERIDLAIPKSEVLFWLYHIVSEGHMGRHLGTRAYWGGTGRDIYEIGIIVMHVAKFVQETGKLPESFEWVLTLKPPAKVTPADPGTLRVVRDVVIVTDNIDDRQRDMARMRRIADRLTAKGVRTREMIIDPDGEFQLLKRHRDNIVLARITYNCAGTIRGYQSAHFQNLLARRPFIYVNWSPRTRLKGLRWLPRAHDDNFSPRGFTGIAYPYQALRNAGIFVDESRNYDHIASSIFNHAVERVPKAPKGGAYGVTGLTPQVTEFLNQFVLPDMPLCYDVPPRYTRFLTPGRIREGPVKAPIAEHWIRDIVKPFINQGYRRMALFQRVGIHLFQNTSHEWYRGTRIGAKEFWRRRRGNCAESAHLARSVFGSLGFPTAYVGGFDRTGERHYWNEVYLNGRWFSVDIDKISRNRLWYADPWVHRIPEHAIWNRRDNKWLVRGQNILN